MKKFILSILLITSFSLLFAQTITLSLPDVNVTGFTGGEEVLIDITVDDITIEDSISGFQLSVRSDDTYLAWNGTNTVPTPGVPYLHPNLTPLGADWLWNNGVANELVLSWVEPTFFSPIPILPGEVLLTLSFTYLGGLSGISPIYLGFDKSKSTESDQTSKFVTEVYDENFGFFAITPIDGSIGQYCATPSDLTINNITSTSANFSWQSPSGLSNLEWGEAGFSPGTGTYEYGITGGAYTLIGLTQNTTYDIYIQDDCGGYQSGWIGPLNFRTCLLATGKWIKDESPYFVGCDMSIVIGDTLIIEPGVEIIFEDYYTFDIYGTLLANGSEYDSIKFTVSDTSGFYIDSHAGWGGLNFDYSSLSQLQYCIIEYSKSAGIDLSNSGGCYLVHSTICNNQTGITNLDGPITFENISVYSNKGDAITIDSTSGIITDFELKNNLGRGLICNSLTTFNISNGIIENNTGGGVFIAYEAGTYLDNLVIEGNGSSAIEGGGIYMAGGCQLSNLTIRNNLALNGGGIACNSWGEDIFFNNLLIENNTATQNGGGFLFQSDGVLSFLNSKIINNTATNGGGIYMNPNFPIGAGVHTFESIEVSLNQALDYGGGIYNRRTENANTAYKNLTITSNSAGISGGGLYVESTGITTTLTNIIFWNDTPDEIDDPTGIINIAYSDIEGGWVGMGNINSDPFFVDPTNGDYHLKWVNFPLEDYSKSPCIDTGDPISPNDPDGSNADMGSYPFDRAYYEQFLPVINSIVDVPNDQGKQLVLNWTRSILDNPEDGTIGKYTIWRKQNWAKEPWEYMGYTPAQNFEEYAFIAPTISDSGVNEIPYFTYTISAVNFDSTKFYYAYPDSGYSVDNLAPYTPDGLSGLFENESIILNWNNHTDEDFDHFAIYKSANPTNFPMNPYITLNDTMFTDYDFVYDTLHYYITAFDMNGNESMQSDTIKVPVGITLNLKVFLEGPFFISAMIPYLNINGYIPLSQPYNQGPWNYDGGESVDEITNSYIVDWLLLEFRDATSADLATKETMIGRQAVFLTDDGKIVGLDGISQPRCNIDFDNNLYMVIWHRNHLAIMTANPLEEIDGSYNYDFTSDTENVYKGAYSMKDLGLCIFGLYAADANADNQVDNKDKNESWELQQGETGYKNADFNLDSQVDENDKTDQWLLNVGLGSYIPN